jgi:hypothetical protein
MLGERRPNYVKVSVFNLYTDVFVLYRAMTGNYFRVHKISPLPVDLGLVGSAEQIVYRHPEIVGELQQSFPTGYASGPPLA